MSFPTRASLLNKMGWASSALVRWAATIDAATQKQTQQGSVLHTGGVGASSTTMGTDTTPATTTTYIAEVLVPFAVVLTGLALLNGSAAAGNIQLALADGTGKVIAMTASVAQSGTNAFQRVPFASQLSIASPGKYYVMAQFSSASARFRSHALGNFETTTQTGGTYGTFSNLTPPGSFTASVGPIMDTY